MNNKDSELRAELVAKIAILNKEVQDLYKAIYEIDQKPENNSYDDWKTAVESIEYKLYKEASADCQGSYNCGNPIYTKKFMFDEKVWIGQLAVEYNRYNKTYYHIESTNFETYELTNNEKGNT
jgi:hypothetical protein